MMRRLFLIAASLAALPAAMGQNNESLDVVITKQGQEMKGRVSGRTSNGIQLRSQSSTGAQVAQVVPIANIESIEFADADKLAEEIAQTTKADAGRMLRRWRQDEAYLDIPNSPAGAVGVRTAQLLLETGGADNAKTAGEILDKVTSSAWNVVDQDRAKALNINSLRLTGKTDEARKAAEEFLKGDASAEGKAEVSYYLGEILAGEYAVFIEENPRWESDPYMRPKRQRLYNGVLDHLIAPYLQYGAPAEVTPKSLLSTVQFLDKYGENNEAVGIAEDLTTIFASSPQAAEAKKFLENN